MEEASLDQALVYDPQDDDLVYDKVDEVMEQALLRGPEVAMQMGRALRQGGQTRALALAHLLHSLKSHWESFPTDDTFEDAVFKGMGLSKQTTDKYVRVWGRIFDSSALPGPTKMALLGKPINSLLAVSAAAGDGQIDEDHWLEITRAPDTASVKKIVQSIRGRQTSSNTALIYMYDRDGSLKYRRGNRPYRSLGFLPQTDDEDDMEALDTFLRRGGAVKR